MSERTVAEKLLVKSGDALAVIAPPSDLATLLGPFPAGVRESGMSEATAAVVFVRTRAELLAHFDADLPQLASARAV